jgi:hypothetical protein
MEILGAVFVIAGVFLAGLEMGTSEWTYLRKFANASQMAYLLARLGCGVYRGNLYVVHGFLE